MNEPARQSVAEPLKKAMNGDKAGNSNSVKFDMFKEEIKTGMYGGFFVLLRSNEQGNAGGSGAVARFVIIYLILLLQILSYTFNTALGETWKSPTIIKYVSPILSTFRLVYWLEKVPNWDIYIIVYYVSIFFLFFIMINFIYVAYCFRQRKFPFTWPIPLLRYSCYIITTVLYIPILELFVKFSACQDNGKGELHHVIYPDIVCFQGIHILHVTLSYFMIVIFLSMCFLITSCLYENRLGKLQTAIINPDSHLVMLAVKALYVFAFVFFRDTSAGHTGNVWFLSIVLFVGSALVFMSFVINRPYFENQIQQIVTVFKGLFLWANTCLLFSCIVKNLEFTGNLTLVLLGSPFIVVSIIGLKDPRKGRLMKSLSKIESPDSFQRYINYYMTLVETKEQDRDAAMTLKGYVNYHSEFCVLDDCPLRNFKKQMIRDHKKEYGQFGPIFGGAVSAHSAMSFGKSQITSLESPALLISQAKNLYINAIKQFPKSVALKIDYAWFLLNKLMNKRDALKELINAEKHSLSTFSESFIIYRYRQIIEDELYEQDPNSLSNGGGPSGGLDYVAALNYDNHFKLLRTLIEKSAMMHYDFWTGLLDDQPDIIRIKFQGQRINQSIHDVELQWKKLLLNSQPTVKALKLYAQFLIEIMNDREHGNEQLIKAKEMAISRIGNRFDNFNSNQDQVGAMEDFSAYAPDGSPCVFISGESERLGQITQCNMSMLKVFGFSRKDEVIGKDVEILMPRVYAKQHRKFLEAALQKPSDLISAKERQVFGKHSSGYIFPLWMSIKNVPSFVTGRQFAATFKVEKSGINKNVAYLILDKNKRIHEASASAIAMLEIDLNKFQKIKAFFDISKHLPSLFGPNFYQYVNKAGSHIDYQYPAIKALDQHSSANDEESNFEAQSTKGGALVPISGDDTYSVHMKVISKRQGTIANNNNRETNDMEEGQEDVYNQHGTQASITSRMSKNQDFNVVGKMQSRGYDESETEGANENATLRRGETEVLFQNKLETQPQKMKKKTYDYQIIPSQTRQHVTFLCNMVEIHFDTPNLENPNPGFYIRLESIQDKQVGIAKVTKAIKQSTFQFSYDTLNKSFCRELRDKENKDIVIDRNFLSLKTLKENYRIRQVENPSYEIPSRIAHLTYLEYLTKYQQWITLGRQGDIMQFIENAGGEENDDDDPSESESDAVSVSSKHKKSNSLNKKKSMDRLHRSPTNKMGAGTVPENQMQDLKKILNQQQVVNAQTKEFLKSEIHRMVQILKKKQEDCGNGVRTFRRVDATSSLNRPKKTNSTPEANLGPLINNNQIGQYEECEFQVASLFTGRSSEVINEDIENDENDDNSSKKKKSGSQNQIRNTIKSRKAFQMALTDTSMPPAILRLSRLANILLLCLMALAIIDYSTVFKQLKDTITNYKDIEYQMKRVGELQKVGYNVRSLVLLNTGILTNWQGFASKTELASGLKKGLQDSLNELYTIQNAINLSPLSLSSQHQSLQDEKTVPLYFRQDPAKASMKAIKFSLNEAMLQIQSSIFTLSNMNLSDFQAEDGTQSSGGNSDDVFFIMQNVYNDLFSALLTSFNFYIDELQDRTSHKNEVSLIIFILSICTLSILAVALVPVVRTVNRHKNKVLMLFCEIEDSAVRRLAEKCERFMLKMAAENSGSDQNGNQGDQGENESGNDDIMVGNPDEDEEYTGAKGQRNSGFKKRPRNVTKTSNMFYIKFLTVILVIEAYFSYQFGSIRQFASSTAVQVQELNITAAIYPFLWFNINTQRELYYSPAKKINGTNSSLAALNQIYMMSMFTSKLELGHTINAPDLQTTYNDQFDLIMRHDLCPKQTFFPKVEQEWPQCRAFVSGMATSGLNLILINFTKSLRLLLSTYNQYVLDTKKDYAKVRSIILNSPEIYDIFLMQKYFIEPNMRGLTSALNTSITANIDTHIQRMLFLMIFFLILLLLGYVAAWIPLISELNTQINKTKLMLMIVPMEILMRMKGIAKVLEGSAAGQDLLENSGMSQTMNKGKSNNGQAYSSRSISGKSN